MTEPVTPENQEGEIYRIKGQIAKLIEDHFTEGSEHVYLSRLGAELRADRKLLEQLTGSSLSEFIRNNFSYELRKTGQNNNILYLAKPGVAWTPVERPQKRYIPRFWAAFAKPLNDQEDRYLDLETLRFGPDRTALAGTDGDVRPIGAQFIAPKDSSGSAADVVARIELWLKEQGLDAERFVLKHRRSAETPTLLTALLRALTTDELKRVSIPLDIVRRLSDHER